MNTEPFSLPINLIRQWCYCPRVVYYQETLQAKISRPAWVKQGEDFHQLEENLWKRRKLSRFNLESGQVYHQLNLRSSQLELHGIVDMAIETKEEVYAIEFKLNSKHKKRKDIMQLTAYAMLLQEHFNKPSNFAFLIGSGKDLHLITVDEEKKNEVIKISHKIKTMLQKGLKPNSDATEIQCSACEYINFCNDRF